MRSHPQLRTTLPLQPTPARHPLDTPSDPPLPPPGPAATPPPQPTAAASRLHPPDPHPKSLHTGIPPCSPWLQPDTPATHGTLWSSLQCGPHHIALAGYTTTRTANLRVGSLNTNGLTSPKLSELLWYMRLEQLDSSCLTQVPPSGQGSSSVGRHMTSLGAPGSRRQSTPPDSPILGLRLQIVPPGPYRFGGADGRSPWVCGERHPPPWHVVPIPSPKPSSGPAAASYKL